MATATTIRGEKRSANRHDTRRNKKPRTLSHSLAPVNDASAPLSQWAGVNSTPAAGDVSTSNPRSTSTSRSTESPRSTRSNDAENAQDSDTSADENEDDDDNREEQARTNGEEQSQTTGEEQKEGTPAQGRAASRPRNSVIVIDVGHNQSSLGYRFGDDRAGQELTVLDGYPGQSENHDTAQVVPSVVAYRDGRPVSFGHSLSNTTGVEGTTHVRYFKALLNTEESSRLRDEADAQVTEGRLDEDDPMTGYLAMLLAHLQQRLGGRDLGPVDIVAALPAQADNLAIDRYTQCLREAAQSAMMQTRSVRIFSESTAALSSFLGDLMIDGQYCVICHDGGGGTTNCQAMVVTRRGNDVTKIRDSAPRSIWLGGEDLKLRFERFCDDHLRKENTKYRELDQDLQRLIDSTLQALWDDTIKPKDDWLGAVPPHLASVLAAANICVDPSLCQRIEDEVFTPVMHQMRAFVQQSVDACEQWMADARPADPAAERRVLTKRIVSSGGMVHQPRLKKMMQQEFGDAWLASRFPRQDVLKGCVRLYDSLSRDNRLFAVAQRGYAVHGFVPCKQK